MQRKIVKTGFNELDYNLIGFYSGELILLGARPAMGKTSFALNIVENNCLRNNKACIIFDLDNGGIQISQKLICSYAKIDFNKPYSITLTTEEKCRLNIAQSALNKSKIFIEQEYIITPEEIKNRCFLAKERLGKLDFIVINGLKYVRENNTDYQRPNKKMTEAILQKLRIIAKEFNLPILITSSAKLLRNGAIQSTPVHLDALGLNYKNIDIILFLQRLDALATREDLETRRITSGMSEMIIAKSPRGKKVRIPLHFIPFQGRFIYNRKNITN